MIAKIEPAFSSMSTLSRKIDYQLEKISSGEAKNYSTLRVTLYLLFLIICFFSLRLITG